MPFVFLAALLGSQLGCLRQQEAAGEPQRLWELVNQLCVSSLLIGPAGGYCDDRARLGGEDVTSTKKKPKKKHPSDGLTVGRIERGEVVALLKKKKKWRFPVFPEVEISGS